MDELDPSIYGLAIEAMSPTNFEVFGQSVLFEALGIEFEPTGGRADGGQDGYLRERKGRPTHYVQISKEKDVRGKVRRTLDRLRESQRSVDTLTLLTSENFPTRDLFEGEIEKETGIQLRIHDRVWIAVQLTQHTKLRQIFRERSAEAIRSAEKIASTAIQSYTNSERMSVLVYMDAHARSVSKDTDLLTLAVDAAIYKALEGTDPSAGIFKTAEEIVARVEETFPAVKKKPGLKIGERLERLSSKQNNPRIRRYPAEDKYCLPAEVRDELSQENLAVQQLELEFLESLRGRAAEVNTDLSPAEIEVVIGAAMTALTQTFEHQGMNLAASFEETQAFEEVKTYEFVREAIPVDRTDNERRFTLIDACTRVLRGAIYSGSDLERRYVFQLFKLYSLEFVTRGDDRVTSYFRSSLKTLRLMLGTDILLRALSEVCVNPGSQATQNALRYLGKAGAQLLLSEFVLDELYTHLIAENREFDGHYRDWYQYASLDELRQCDRILLRAFFYSNKEPERHHIHARSWENFLSLMGEYEWFKNRNSREYFASYLINKFDLAYVSAKEIGDGISGFEVKRLKDQIVARRSAEGRDILAENDARHALYVNRYRQLHSEAISANVYGYSTWWVMEEFQVIQAAQAIKVPSRFSIHPQFLMNFCVLSPGLRDLTEEFRPFFPTNFGMRISERVSEGVLRTFLRKAKDAAKAEEAVAKARMRALGDELRETFYRND